MPTVTPFLWFEGHVQEAVDFYTSLFGDSSVRDVSHYPESSPMLPGEVMLATLHIGGQDVMILNGGPHYHLSPAASLFVSCEDQAEVDFLWDRLCDGGEPGQCGWLVDRYGLSWQIVPTALGRLLGDPNPERSARAMQAMLRMTKLDVAALEAAADGAP